MKMISNLKYGFGNHGIGIHPIKHNQLVTQLRVARTNEMGNLDKTHGNLTFDLFDAFRLSMIRYTQDGIEVIKKK